MTVLLFLLIPVALLFVAHLYAAAHSNTSKTAAESIVRWLYIAAWFATALAEGAARALTHYRELRWAIKEQPVCEAYRPWEDRAEPQQLPASMSLAKRLKVWEA